MPPKALAISPLLLMWVAAALTLGVYGAYGIVRRRRQRLIAALARQWQMHYSPNDVFNLAPRIASRLPVPGAADVRVRDLLYGTEPAGHRCIFCAEYTVGVVRSRKRRWSVLSVFEPRGRSDAPGWASLRIAPEDLPLVEQYESLRASMNPAPAAAGPDKTA